MSEKAQKTLTIKVSAEEHKRLKVYSAEEGKSLSRIIRERLPELTPGEKQARQ